MNGNNLPIYLHRHKHVYRDTYDQCANFVRNTTADPLSQQLHPPDHMDRTRHAIPWPSLPLCQQHYPSAPTLSSSFSCPPLSPSALSVTQAGDFASVEWTGQGAVIQDILGRRFIDCLGGFGLLNLGWSHPEVVSAVKAQLERAPMPSQVCGDWRSIAIGR